MEEETTGLYGNGVSSRRPYTHQGHQIEGLVYRGINGEGTGTF